MSACSQWKGSWQSGVMPLFFKVFWQQNHFLKINFIHITWNRWRDRRRAGLVLSAVEVPELNFPHCLYSSAKLPLSLFFWASGTPKTKLGNNCTKGNKQALKSATYSHFQILMVTCIQDLWHLQSARFSFKEKNTKT